MTIDVKPLLQRRWPRLLSLVLAIPMALLLLIHPAAMVDQHGHYNHSLLMSVMWGVSIGFIHGVGYLPRLRIWQFVFHPLLGWALLAMGYLLLIKVQFL